MTIANRAVTGIEESHTGGNETVIPALKVSAVYLRWGGTRNRAEGVAKAFGAELVAMTWHTKKPWLVPIRYLVQFIQTLVTLVCRRPRVVFSQHTQPFCSLAAILYCKVAGCCAITDCHNAPFTDRQWQSWPFLLLNRLIYRHARLNLVHNEEILKWITMVGQAQGRFAVLHDPIPQFSRRDQDAAPDVDVLVIGSFAEDEPVSEILKGASLTPDWKYVLTGDANRLNDTLRAGAAKNVHFPGFLPDGEYDCVLSRAKVVVALSTRENVLMRAMHEALGAGVPLVTTDTPAARAYFTAGTIFVRNSAENIVSGIRAALAQQDRLRSEMVSLCALRRTEWEREIEGISRILETEVL